MPSKKPIKVGVVGIGNFGQHHVRIYSQMPGVELVGIAEIDGERGRECAKQYNVAYYSDYRELFGKVKAVNIAVPTSLHYKMARDFLLQEADVLVEKPITTDLNQAKKLVDLAKEQGLILQVGHLERFNPAVLELRKIVGTPLFIETRRLAYPTKQSLDVGIVWDLMIHDIDIIISLINSPIEDIRALGLSVYSQYEDFALVQILFKNGAIANLIASRISGEKLRQLRVVETEKTILLDFMNQTLSVLRPPRKGKAVPPESVPVNKSEPLRLELEHFMECVRTNKEPMVSGEDGKKALDLAVQITAHMRIVKDKGHFEKEIASLI
ncbi:MAG: Gfo/Idh/MocA family oxidoreductase [bacterium]